MISVLYLGSKDCFCAVPDHGEHFVFAQIVLRLLESALLDDHPVEFELDGSPLHNLLVHRVLSHHSVHSHLKQRVITLILEK